MKSSLLAGMPAGRPLGEIAPLRDAIFTTIREATASLPEVTSQNYVLRVQDVDYERPRPVSLAEKKKALLAGQTPHWRLRGTLLMADTRDGSVVDKRRVTLAKVPYLHDDGTFILRGVPYGMLHQKRLRPGIFARIRQSGEAEAHVNVARGLGHRYILDPASGIFKIQLGQSYMPLLPVLRILGARDRDIRQAWGDKLFAANLKYDINTSAVRKLYKKIVPAHVKATTESAMEDAIRREFQRMELDPEVTRRTLGAPHRAVDASAVLAATRKVLQLSQGKADPDDRDSELFQVTVGPEDVFAERIRKGVSELRRRFWRAALQRNLQKMPTGILDDVISGTITGSGLGQVLQEINPAELLDNAHRVTRMGEGGITSHDAVPDSARDVQPTQLGYADPVHTPESAALGVESRLAINTIKGKDGRLYTRYQDAKTGKLRWLSPQDVADLTVALPGELDRDTPFVAALRRERLTLVPRRAVDVALYDMTDTFGPLTNMVPLKTAVFPQRVSMGSRMLTQALPLVNREAPLLQAGIPGAKDQSFESVYGTRLGAIRSPQDGTVVRVLPDAIILRGADGQTRKVELNNNVPYARKTLLHNTPTVRAGDQVKAGQLLASSNFTDEQGQAALGLNARVGYIPYKGLNYEDAIVISESFAKRMTAESAYQEGLDKTADITPSRKKFVALFPSKYKKDILSKFDDDGVIRPGTVVRPDEPLILAVRRRSVGPRLRRQKYSFVDASVIWEHQHPGVVTDVHHDDKGITVLVKTQSPLQVGDKLAGRYGNKGVISKIIPDDQMPHTEDGKPLEVLLNPLGLTSRGNPVQAIEALLGKIARKRGKPYRLPDFPNMTALYDFALQEAEKHGIPAAEKVIDPETGKPLGDGALVGERFLMALHHSSESKLQGRDIGQYTSEGLPAKGGKAGAKRLGLLNTYALLSHGAYGVLRDAVSVRGQRNEDYWLRLMSGNLPATPKTSPIFQKFVNELKAAGINVVRQGPRFNIMAMTNKDARELSGGRELKNVETVNWKDNKLEPIPGGLFDKTLTGGHDGTRWSYIKLHQPLPNPAMEEPIMRLLGLTKKEFADVLAGNREIRGFSGPDALEKALKAYNIDAELARARLEMRGSAKTKRDAAIRRMRYLKGLKATGQHPSDWILDRVPVLPPKFRPVSLLAGSNVTIVANPNYLYKEVWDANQALKALSGQVADLSEERKNLYNAFKAVVGLGGPVDPKHREQRVRGLLQTIFGTSPKYGTVQRKLLGAQVDLTGRAVVTPDPDLDMDQLGVPIEQAWTMFRPFVVRRLSRKGIPLAKAMSMVEERAPEARRALLEEMEVRPVIMDRAPVLHRFGILAFRATPVQGNTLRVPPIVTPGFGMDFDGDASQVHVVVTDEALRDLDKMFPSRNLLSPADFQPINKPAHEYQGGLWLATVQQNNKTPVRTFATMADVKRAYLRGEISHDQKVRILQT